MSEDADNRPGDVWITGEVDVASNVPSKYFSLNSKAVFPYGLTGPCEIRTKFNLTAYVRDMIAEAVK